MPLIVNNNPASIAAQRSLTVNTNQLQRSVERLARGRAAVGPKSQPAVRSLLIYGALWTGRLGVPPTQPKDWFV